jgi:O-methyltransferase
MNEIVKNLMSDFQGIKFIMLADGQIDYILDNLASTLDLPGAVVELGCNVGMTTSFMQRFLDLAGSNKDIHVYESFKGLPEKTEGDGETASVAGESTVSIHDFINTFKLAKLRTPYINEGWFREIPDEQYPDQICFAFFDGDFYSSIIDSFEKVYHKMVTGGIILVHDFMWQNYPGVQKACEDFLKEKPEKMTQEINGIGKMTKL